MGNKKACMEDKSTQKYLSMSPFNFIDENFNLTACVGENGSYNQTTIYNGFVDSVHTLIESIKEYKNQADPMVYPILFCARHSMELFLKKFYADLQYLQRLKNNPSDFNKLQKAIILNSHLMYLLGECDENTDHSKKLILQKRHEKLKQYIHILSGKLLKKLNADEFTHDLSALIDKILTLYQIDEHIMQQFDSVLPLLNYYKNIDPAGDVFRYWFNKNGAANFQNKNISIVRIDIVDIQFKKIISYFEKIEFTMWCLLQEYKTGTFTKKLSRSQIEEISKLLPKPDEFNNKIKGAKKKIKEQYQISSNEFDRVLDLIRKHREFSANMGKERPFLHISDNAFNIFAKCALGLDDWKSAYHHITSQELNLFITFSAISGWRFPEKNYAYFSENLEQLYRGNKRKQTTSYFNIAPQKEILYVINGFKKCGQITYAQKLKQYFEGYKCIAENESPHRP